MRLLIYPIRARAVEILGELEYRHGPALTGGGPLKIQGRWAQVLSLRRKGEEESFDERQAKVSS